MKIISKKDYKDIPKIVKICYLSCCAISGFIFIKIPTITTVLTFITLMCLIPIISWILNKVFRTMIIVYDNQSIYKILNALNKFNGIIQVSINKNIVNNIQLVNEINKENIYISIDYKFNTHKYVFTDLSKISHQQIIKQKTCFIPKHMHINIYENNKSIHKLQMCNYSYLLDAETQCVDTIESVLITALNDAIRFIIINCNHKI